MYSCFRCLHKKPSRISSLSSTSFCLNTNLCTHPATEHGPFPWSQQTSPKKRDACCGGRQRQHQKTKQNRAAIDRATSKNSNSTRGHWQHGHETKTRQSHRRAATKSPRSVPTTYYITHDCCFDLKSMCPGGDPWEERRYTASDVVGIRPRPHPLHRSTHIYVALLPPHSLKTTTRRQQQENLQSSDTSPPPNKRVANGKATSRPN